MKKALVSWLLGVTVVGGLVSCGNTVSQEEYNELQESNKEIEEKLDSVSKERDDYKKLYEESKEEAKLYLELDGNEKQIVDAKIDEVNKATEEQLAQEKAQKEAEEAAKKQAEEEAKRKVEEEEKTRKEEEERQKAEAEKKYIDATNFIKECADASGYKFDITRNGNKIDIYYNAGGDIKVSELIKQGISKEEIISMSGYDNLRNIYKETASSFQQQVNSLYSEDIIITIAVAFNGETCYKVDGNVNVIIDLLK